jgi:hypothetical protein
MLSMLLPCAGVVAGVGERDVLSVVLRVSCGVGTVEGGVARAWARRAGLGVERGTGKLGPGPVIGVCAGVGKCVGRSKAVACVLLRLNGGRRD